LLIKNVIFFGIYLACFPSWNTKKRNIFNKTSVDFSSWSQRHRNPNEDTDDTWLDLGSHTTKYSVYILLEFVVFQSKFLIDFQVVE